MATFAWWKFWCYFKERGVSCIYWNYYWLDMQSTHICDKVKNYLKWNQHNTAELHYFVLSCWYCDKENSFNCYKCGSHPPLFTLLFIQNIFHVDLICLRAGRTFHDIEKHQPKPPRWIMYNHQSKLSKLMLTFQMWESLFRLCSGLAINKKGLLMGQNHVAITISGLLCSER